MEGVPHRDQLCSWDTHATSGIGAEAAGARDTEEPFLAFSAEYARFDSLVHLFGRVA